MKTSAVRASETNWSQSTQPIPSANQKQIELVRTVLTSLNQDYSPPILEASINILKEKQMRAAFEEWLMELMTPDLFKDLQELSPLHKKLFLASLDATEMFLRHFNLAIKKSAQGYKGLDPSEVNADELEKSVIIHMNELCLNEHFLPLVPSNFDEEHLSINLRDKIAALLREWLPKNARQEFLLLFLSCLLQKMADRLFSPDIIQVFLDKLLHDDFKLDKSEATTQPFQEILYSYDEQFSKGLEDLFTRLAKQAIKIASEGENCFTKYIYSHLINLLVSRYSGWLSHAMQRLLNRMFNSDASFNPLIFTAELLYTSYKDQIIPTMHIFLKKEDQKMQEILERVKQAFHRDLLYQKINQKIKNGNPNIWTRLTKDSTKIKKLSANLENAAWIFFQRPLLLKTFLGYLLDKIKISIQTSNEEVYAKNSH